MNRESAVKLLHDNIKNQNLRRHCYAVEATMRALAKHFGDDEDLWGIAGLIHDADYEAHPKEHPQKLLQWLKDLDAKTDIYDAVAAHAWGYSEGFPEPKTKMQWSLYSCDELTGLIVAVALVKPEKKLSSVSVESVMKKWKNSGFAAGVDRSQIENCKSRLGIELEQFIQITLSAMQEIHQELGL